LKNHHSQFTKKHSDLYNDIFAQADLKTQSVIGRRSMHQVMLAMIYNKLVLLHLNPTPSGQQTPLLHLYELDPGYSYRIPTPVPLNPQSAGHLIQLQIVENLIVVHDMDAKVTQAYDLKIGSDFGIGLLKEGCQVEKDGSRGLMDVLADEEVRMADDNYKITI
jgi:hypothetical protein